MKYSIIFHVLFFTYFSTSLSAQTLDKNLAFIYSKEELLCGNRIVTGVLQKNNGEKIVFEEGNTFYLELSTGSSRQIRIPAIKTFIDAPDKAVFELPDTLKKGSQYFFKMSSTKPALSTWQIYDFEFGVGIMSFQVDFEQQKYFYSGSPLVSLDLNVSFFNSSRLVRKNSDKIKVELQTNDKNLHYVDYYGPSKIDIIGKDSLNIFKIDNAVNQCGIQASAINGQAIVVRKDYLETLDLINPYPVNVTFNQRQITICGNKTVPIKVISKAINTKTNFRVELAENPDFTGKTYFFDAIRRTEDVIEVNIPSPLQSLKIIYLKALSENPTLKSSNYMTVYIDPVTESVKPTYRFVDKDVVNILFDQFSQDRQLSSSQITELIVNGIDIVKSGSLMQNFWSLKLPQNNRDTVLTFSKISNTCGNLKNLIPELKISVNSQKYFKLKTPKSSFCQGESAQFSFEGNIDIPKINVFYNIWGDSYSDVNKSYSFSSLNYSEELPYDLDAKEKTISVKIPNDINAKIIEKWSNIKFRITGIYLSVNPFIEGVDIEKNNVRVDVNIPPIIKTLTSEIISNIGVVNIPISYIGSTPISYNLSDGSKGFIGNNITYLGLYEDNIPQFLDKSTELRIISAENICGNTVVNSKVDIKIDTSQPSLSIDIAKAPSVICKGSGHIRIPYLKLGNWNNINSPIDAIVANYSGDRLLYTSTYDAGNNFVNIINLEDITRMEIRFETRDNKIKSQVFSIRSMSKPSEIKYFHNYATNSTIDYQKQSEVIYVRSGFDNAIIFSNKGENVTFTINNTKIKSNGSFQIPTPNDTTFFLSNATNVCGVVEINKTIKVVNTKTLLVLDWFHRPVNYTPSSNCAGSKRSTNFGYLGVLPPRDSLVIQLAKYNSNDNITSGNLNYFNVKTTLSGNNVDFIIPDTCSGNYVYRIYSLVYKNFSNLLYLQRIIPLPNVKLTSSTGQTELTVINQAKLVLKSNYWTNGWYKINLENDKDKNLLSHYVNLGVNNMAESQEEVIVGLNRTKVFKISSVYSQCGYGKSEGMITAKVLPTVQINKDVPTFSTSYCNNDSLLISLDYNGDFPIDTLMGIYLNRFDRKSFNYELLTFKNNPQQIKVRLPQDLPTNPNYYLQVRKKSRSKNYFTDFNPSDKTLDSLSKLNFDSQAIRVYILNPPNVNLTGNNEIFAGNPSNLILNFVDKDGKSLSDSLKPVYATPSFFTLSDGKKYTFNKDLPIITVFPEQTTTYTIKSIRNVCGEGLSNGTATVSVFPMKTQRIVSFQSSSLNRRRYSCLGMVDSVDVICIGFDIDTDFSKLKVFLSDKSFINYSQINTIKVKSIGSITSDIHQIRLWFELPKEFTKGFYKMKVGFDDVSILSTPYLNQFNIIEQSTASLDGKTNFFVGEKITATVKLTGTPPWYLSVTDADNKVVFNNIPDANGGMIIPNPILTNEYKLELTPIKTNTYKVKEVIDTFCGSGTVSGEFSVDLILANDDIPIPVIKMYPNPTTSNLMIDLPIFQDKISINIFDLQGKLIESLQYRNTEADSKQTINLKNYNSGVYLLKVIYNKYHQVYRIIKN